MASETVDPIDWSHPTHPTQDSTPWAPRIAQFNAGCKSQDLLHWLRCERATFGTPGQRTACADTQGITKYKTVHPYVSRIYFKPIDFRKFFWELIFFFGFGKYWNKYETSNSSLQISVIKILISKNERLRTNGRQSGVASAL